MCGRFLLDSEIREIIEAFSVEDSQIEDYNKGEFCPSSNAPIIIQQETRILLNGRWGFKVNGGSEIIFNARSESVSQKPLFKNSFSTRRCIIPATQFYEWKKEAFKKTTKYGITKLKGELMAFGGIYNTSKDENNKETLNFVILTTSANIKMSEVHHRMPLILQEEEIDMWLSAKNSNQISSDIFRESKFIPLVVQELRDSGRPNMPEQISMF